MIKEYFRNYLWNICDTTLFLGQEPRVKFHSRHSEEDWQVTLADTGADSLTGERIERIRSYLENDDTFLLTYGDGVGNIDIPASIELHRSLGRTCTITAVHPPGRFGEISFESENHIREFNEKPQTEVGYINGGYMVCNTRVFDYIAKHPRTMFEQEPLRQITSEGQLAAYKHTGFWQPMDTYQEFGLLNSLWEQRAAPWKVW
jgi:glucose-1-phosphate cytidylyltransferase